METLLAAKEQIALAHSIVDEAIALAILHQRDELLRLNGVGDLTIFGERQYSLRIWLDPEKLAGFGLTAGDVVRAIQEQNVQVSGGALGQQPAPADNAFQLIVTTQGRFEDPRQFRQIIVRSTPDGRLVRVQDVARVELGAQDYFTNSYLNGKPAVALAIFQRPGTNALQAASQIVTTMQGLKVNFQVGKSGVEVAKQVGAGKPTVGAAIGDTAIIARAQGIPVKAVAVHARHAA